MTTEDFAEWLTNIVRRFVCGLCMIDRPWYNSDSDHYHVRRRGLFTAGVRHRCRFLLSLSQQVGRLCSSYLETARCGRPGGAVVRALAPPGD